MLRNIEDIINKYFSPFSNDCTERLQTYKNNHVLVTILEGCKFSETIFFALNTCDSLDFSLWKFLNFFFCTIKSSIPVYFALVEWLADTTVFVPIHWWVESFYPGRIYSFKPWYWRRIISLMTHFTFSVLDIISFCFILLLQILICLYNH